ncbi:hypothetical protein GCM10025867_04990 [Frondihabitans sucicola]|uniref:RiboL-PSP-HEPN domain-containing protein n=1 Tax=Frondihabitans sucicola TaxID=1268041 RepID=A0ABN6XVU1_9MICO|nr:hypothetical protein GCM10025867_04990 [Frondihabitans sucicola]
MNVGEEIQGQPEPLEAVLAAASRASASLTIPVRMIDLHREVAPSRRQQALRWGAFLLIYGPLERFYNEVLESKESTRTLPLNPDKLRDRALELHQVHLFNSKWSLRTRVPSPQGWGRSRWVLYESTTQIRRYLGDMKSLRDHLSHGGDPCSATNTSGSLWKVKDGWSMRLMGVEGFLQAACDLMEQTIIAFGGSRQMIEWPVPVRSGLSAEPMPVLRRSTRL